MTITDILDPATMADGQEIEPILDALLDQIIQHTTVHAILREDTLHIQIDENKSEVRGPRLQTYFRIILAGLGARAAHLAGREFTPYQNAYQFMWRDKNIFVAINNQLRLMEFKTETN